MGYGKRSLNRVRPPDYSCLVHRADRMGIALKMAQDKLPVKTEFISAKTPPRLGDICSSTLTAPVEAQPIPALPDIDTKDEGMAVG